jgi:DNA-binding protein H-NS
VPWLEVQFAFEKPLKDNAMTNSYASLKAQIAELEKQAAQVRETEISAAKNQVREIMQTYGLTIADLGGATKAPKARKTVAAKYRDAATGQEWTGRGRAPKWLDGKKKDDYLIK